MKFKLGDTDIPFVFRGDELMYPNYVKDGLVLHYDFSGMTNADTSRGVAKDLSGNGNHGTLQNFNYSAESGYDKNKLLFDGVDDYIIMNSLNATINATLSFNFNMETDIPINHVDLFSFSTDIVFRVVKSGSIIFIDKRREPDRFTSESFDIDSSVHVDIVIDKENTSVHVNGEPKGQLNPTDFVLTDVTSIATLGRMSSAIHYGGDINSVKIYNRPLTPEEIAHNYAIEKERFGIE